MSNAIEVHPIAHTDTLELRQKLLRPNLTPEACVFAGDTDKTTHHFGCYCEHKLVGVASVYKRRHESIPAHLEECFQLRAMATMKEYQGRGLGSKLIGHIILFLETQGAEYLWANSRVSAKGFYERNGFELDKHEFMIDGVGMHVRVSRKL